MLELEAKQRQRLSPGRGKKVARELATYSDSKNCKATQVAAKLTGTNSRYVEIAKSIQQRAPHLIEQLQSGQLTVTVADRLADNENPRHLKRPARATVEADGALSVRCGDCLDLIPDLKNKSVQLVVTSPPYAEQRKTQYKSVTELDYPEWTVRWMELLWDNLTPTGSVLIVIRPHVTNGKLSDYVLKSRLALRDDSWNECDELIWLKPDAPTLGTTVAQDGAGRGFCGLPSLASPSSMLWLVVVNQPGLASRVPSALAWDRMPQSVLDNETKSGRVLLVAPKCSPPLLRAPRGLRSSGDVPQLPGRAASRHLQPGRRPGLRSVLWLWNHARCCQEVETGLHRVRPRPSLLRNGSTATGGDQSVAVNTTHFPPMRSDTPPLRLAGAGASLPCYLLIRCY